MKILGIDPGLATTGWGLLHKDPSGRPVLDKCGAILTFPRDPMPARLKALAEELAALIAAERPGEAAIEDLFISKDSRTAASVGHGRGVALLALAQAGLSIHVYNPRQVKMALTGSGGADKGQMQRMVQRLLGLKDIPRPDDAADAVAVALCHMNTLRIGDLA
jgi:crossover junction endodeoxyribonuclease RuvC